MKTKAEKIILDYTASWKWSQIKKLNWTTAEMMDVFDTYFKKPIDTFILVNRDEKTIIVDGLKDLKRGDLFKICDGGNMAMWMHAESEPEKNKNGKWTINAPVCPF